ncbi:MAG: carboxypeptidase-like regulatory domain-containing protein, partial [Halobacteriales archaeon]|nr:carboxypeptidase-like regulatory domain-containing protein [Halobacteriales archaeon]
MDRTSGPSLVLAAVFLLSALASVPHPTAAQVGTSSLAGSVCSVDQNVYYIKAPAPGDSAGCGTRLAGAMLRLTKPGVGGTLVGAVDTTATSDANGSYQFGALADGAYSLRVARTGYQAASLNVTVAGATTRDVGLRPQPITVTGKVVDTAGAPVAYARVLACCGPTVGGTDAMTDLGGAFALKTEAGERSFTIEKDGRAVLSESRFVDGSKPLAFTVPPPPRPDAVLHGTVTDQDGHPLKGILVNVYSNGGCCSSGQPQPAIASSGPSGGSGTASSGSSTASPAYMRPCCYGGGSNSTTTDGAGRYSMRIFGGDGISVSVYLDGYAAYNKYLQVAQGEDRQLDIQLLKFPAKTAHVEGTVVDAATGKPLRFVSISVQSPAYGIYECSQEPSADGTPPPKPMPAEGGADDGSVGIAIAPSPPNYDNGCAITLSPDGTFRGNVTPGYAIVQAYHDSYRDCPQAPDSPYVPCMPEHY